MNQNEKYMFYKNQMEKKLNAIKQGFFGYHTPVSKYVCDGKGVISDQKTEALADRLIHNILDVRAHSDYVMYGAAQRCLRLYIYLFVRAYGDGKKTFGDLLRMAAELRRYYGSLDDLILWETGWEPLDQYMEKMEKEIRESGEGDWETAKDWYLSAWERRVESGRRASGFWDDLNRSYELLAGHRISQEITEEELQQIWERQQSVIRQENECRQELWEQHAELDVDLYEQYMDELTYEQRVREAKKQELQDAAEYVGAEPEEESLAEAQPSSSPAGAELKSRSIFLTREEAEIRAAEEKKRQEAWKKKFKDPDKFLKAYGEFRRLFFCFGMDCEALEDAVICLLCEEGESGLMDEDRFWKMDVQIEHAYRHTGSAERSCRTGIKSR